MLKIFVHNTSVLIDSIKREEMKKKVEVANER